MNTNAQQALEELRGRLRRASLAQVGGFRPPEDPRTSWFGRGVCLPGEGLPTYKGRDLFPLVQINVSGEAAPAAVECLRSLKLCGDRLA